MELEKLKVVFESDIKPLKKAVDQVNKEFKQVKGQVSDTTKQSTETVRKETQKMSKQVKQESKKIESSFKSAFGTISKLLAGLGTAKLGKKMIDLASDLEETQNVADVAFGSMIGKLEDFASTSIQTYGMSEQSAKDIASIHMAMANGMGVGAEQASDMSIEITKLSADMASFFNTTTDITDTALRSIWTGETETLKKYGVVMTQANLERYAMNRGISVSISELDQASQATLRYNYVMETLSYTQGDFARNADSWANQTKVLSEQFKQLGTIIGGWLIKALTPVIQVLNKMIAGFISLANTINAVLGDLFGWDTEQAGTTDIADTTQDIATGFDNATTGADNLGKATKQAGKEADKAGKKAKGALAGFDKLNILSKPQDSSTSSAGGSVGGSAGGTGGITPILPILNDTGTFKVEAEFDSSGATKAIKKWTGNIKKWFANSRFGEVWSDFTEGARANAQRTTEILEGVWSDIQALGTPLKSWFNNEFKEFIVTEADRLTNLWNGLWDSWNLVFSDVWELILYPFLTTVAEDWLPTLTSWATEVSKTWSVMFDETKEIFDLLWSDAIAPVLDLIGTAWTDVSQSISSAWNKYGKPIYDNIRGAIKQIGDVVQEVWTRYLKPIWDLLVSAIEEIWNDSLKPFVDDFIQGVGEIAEAITGWWNETLMPLISWLVDIFQPVFDLIFSEIENIIRVVVDAIKDIIDGLREQLQGLIDFIVGVFSGDWERAWEGIKGIFSGIWNSLVGVVEGVFKLLKVPINWMIEGVNLIIRGLNKIKLPDWLGGYGINIPEIPRLDVGTNYVQKSGLAVIHEGEAVVPKKYNPAVTGGGSQEQVSLLMEQNDLLRQMLNKDTNVYLDSTKATNEQARNARRMQLATGGV